MDRFTSWYVRCALWASMDESEESGGRPMDESYTVADLAPQALAGMLADCARFQAEQAELIAADVERAACDFWLTRNHHGAGFWDGDWPEEVGEKLTAASHAYPECSLYVGDDGRVYLGPA